VVRKKRLARPGVSWFSGEEIPVASLGEASFVAIAAGSGITPVIAIARTLLAVNPEFKLDGLQGEVASPPTPVSPSSRPHGVAEVVLDAPQKLNSLDEQALAELSKAYDDAAAAASRGEVRALLLRGEGRAFCAARDISAVSPESDDAAAYPGGLSIFGCSVGTGLATVRDLERFDGQQVDAP
jgi:Enoyl-CoA hydratase/isomerase